MSGDTQFSILIFLIYAIFIGIMVLISLIPSVINAIGLVRICKKLDVFKPFWRWVWALLFPAVAILRAGDEAGEREKLFCKKMFAHGMIAIAVFVVFAVLTFTSMGAYAAFSETADNIWTIVAFVAMLLFAVLAFLASVWMSIPVYISYFRIFKLYMPDWGAWLTLAGMLVLSDLSFLILPVLSFLPMQKQPFDPVGE
jgi:nitroreductase